MDTATTARVREELSRLWRAGSSPDQVVQRVVELARAVVPGADGVSVTVVEDERPRSVASTCELLARLDGRQYERGVGPCVDVALSGRTVSLPDLAVEERYPEFVASARRAGMRCFASVGVPASPRLSWALNLYSRHGHALDEPSVRAAEELAAGAAVVLAHAVFLASATSTAATAGGAPGASAIGARIEQAKGVLMARLGCSPQTAFELLAEQSEKSQEKLHDVAATIVGAAERVRRPDRAQPAAAVRR